MDVQFTPAHRTAEVDSTRMMVDRLHRAGTAKRNPCNTFNTTHLQDPRKAPAGAWFPANAICVLRL